MYSRFSVNLTLYLVIVLYFIDMVLYLVNYRSTSDSLAANFVTGFTKSNEDNVDDDDDDDDVVVDNDNDDMMIMMMIM